MNDKQWQVREDTGSGGQEGPEKPQVLWPQSGRSFTWEEVDHLLLP